MRWSVCSVQKFDLLAHEAFHEPHILIPTCWLWGFEILNDQYPDSIKFNVISLRVQECSKRVSLQNLQWYS